jgi:hypothetical protein
MYRLITEIGRLFSEIGRLFQICAKKSEIGRLFSEIGRLFPKILSDHISPSYLTVFVG